MPDPAERVLGFDYGSRRIGMAVGQRLLGTAQALAVVGNGDNGPHWPTIEAAIREWQPTGLLVGLPLTLDGGSQPNLKAARRFAEQLRERYALPVALHDERSSSREAARRFAASRGAGQARARDADKLDSLAARVIVESYFQALG